MAARAGAGGAGNSKAEQKEHLGGTEAPRTRTTAKIQKPREVANPRNRNGGVTGRFDDTNQHNITKGFAKQVSGLHPKSSRAIPGKWRSIDPKHRFWSPADALGAAIRRE